MCVRACVFPSAYVCVSPPGAHEYHEMIESSCLCVCPARSVERLQSCCRFPPNEYTCLFSHPDGTNLNINVIHLLPVYLLSSCPPHALCTTKLPWKSLTSIIEYYYMWKTTDRYVQQVGQFWPQLNLDNEIFSISHLCCCILTLPVSTDDAAMLSSVPVSEQKRLKAAEAESKLKQVYIPT